MYLMKVIYFVYIYYISYIVNESFISLKNIFKIFEDI